MWFWTFVWHVKVHSLVIGMASVLESLVGSENLESVDIFIVSKFHNVLKTLRMASIVVAIAGCSGPFGPCSS